MDSRLEFNDAQLKAFVTCARMGHFTRAAKLLHITQPALSHRIASLEETFETSLFVRGRGGVKLTPAGEELLRFCLAREASETEFLASFKSKDLAGVIRIGAFSSVAKSRILPTLAPLLNKHPQVGLEILVRELREIPHLMRRSEVDWIFTYDERPTSGCQSQRIWWEQDIVIQKKGAATSDIWLDHDPEDKTTAEWLGVSPLSLKRRYVGDAHNIIDAVRLGLGCAVVPEHLARTPRGDLLQGIEVRPGKKTKPRAVWLSWNEPAIPTKLFKAVLAEFRKAASERKE